MFKTIVATTMTRTIIQSLGVRLNSFPWASLITPATMRMKSISHQIEHPPQVINLMTPKPM
jgi:hypothetical protein